MRLIAEIPERDHLALLLREALHRHPDKPACLHRVGLHLGMPFVGDVKLYHWQRALCRPPIITHFVPRDGEDPAPERVGTWAVALRRAPRLQEDVGDKILSDRVVSALAAHVQVEVVDEEVVDPLKCGAVALGSAPRQLIQFESLLAVRIPEPWQGKRILHALSHSHLAETPRSRHLPPCGYLPASTPGGGNGDLTVF